MKEEYQDIIDRYLRGEMTPQETESFEKEVSTDATLREQLEFTRTAASAIGSHESKMRKIKQWEKEDKGKQRYWISGIAAAVVILLAGGTYTIIMRNHTAPEPVRGVEQVFTIDTASTKDITENHDSTYVKDDYINISAGNTYNSSDSASKFYREIEGLYSVKDTLLSFTPEFINVKPNIPNRVKIDTILRYPYWKKNTFEGFPFPSKLGAPQKNDSSFYNLLPQMQEMYYIEENK